MYTHDVFFLLRVSGYNFLIKYLATAVVFLRSSVETAIPRVFTFDIMTIRIRQ